MIHNTITPQPLVQFRCEQVREAEDDEEQLGEKTRKKKVKK